MKRKLTFLVVLCFMGTVIAAAQTQVRAVVTDESGEPVIGANVFEKGTTNGVATGIDGSFSLTLYNLDNPLVISYIGYQTKEFIHDGTSIPTIALAPMFSELEEFVVTGYGTQRKKDLTGAVSVLDITDVGATPVSSVDQMMQGKLSGVSVIPDNMPGGGVAVRIRGFGTIRNNDPLYIIDGVPVDGGINFINPNDIESMQVLKDASSASIYGARAANGVVVISTKRGKRGRLKVEIDTWWGVQSSAKKATMLNAQEFGNTLWEAQINDGKTPTNSVYGSGATPVIPPFLDNEQRVPAADTNWVDAILRNALVQSHNMTFSKADQEVTQLFSVAYFNQEGLMKYTGFKRLSGRFNSEYKLFGDKLRIGENFTASHSWGTTVTNNAALGGLLYNAYKMSPVSPVYDLDGNFAGNPFADIANPVGTLYRNKDNLDKNTRLFGNVYVEINPAEGVTLRSNFGADYRNRYKRNFSARYVETNVQQPLSTLDVLNYRYFNWVFTNTANFAREFGKHAVTALAGIEAARNGNEWFTASREGFALDDSNFRYLNAGESDSQKNAGAAMRSSMLSFFGKVDYVFDNRYLFAFTIRRDGSSKLNNNRWSNFPSFSAGWRISEEPFYRFDAISNMKLRFAWGQNGNSDIPAFSTIDSYSSNLNYSNYPIDGSQNSVVTGYTQTRNGNPNLRWETTTQTNIGLDMGFMNNDFQLVLDFFDKITKDILWERTLIGTLGGTNQTIWDNVGKMRNRGIEAELSYRRKLNNDLSFDVAFNVSAIKNKMIELNSDIEYIGLPTGVIHSVNFDQEVSRSTVGQPIGSFFGYKANGLFASDEEARDYTNRNGERLQPDAKAGDIRFTDTNGDGVINAGDRVFIGNPLPDYTAGMTVGANWRNFDINLFFQGMFGNQVYDLTRYLGDFFDQAQYNKSARILDAWSASNPGGKVPRLTLDDPNNNIRPSSYYVQNASFVRLKNLRLGYSIPESIISKLKFSKLYLYLQATNLFTVTRYGGIDPEVGLQNYSNDYRNIDMGVDRGIYPLSRTFTVGLRAGF